MLKAWQVDIRNDKSNKTILELTRAFHAALCRISSEDSDNEPAYYKVDGKLNYFSINNKVSNMFL